MNEDKDQPEQENDAVSAVTEPEVLAGQTVAEAADFAGDSSTCGPTDDLLEQLKQAQRDADENREKHLRVLAEMDTLRRRLSRDREEIRRTAAAALIEDLLPALDNLQIGLDSAANHPEAANVAKGFEFVAQQVQQILEGHGLVGVAPAVGDAFDPNLHEAIGHENSDLVADNGVLRVQRAGYKLNDRLLRPASVVVSSGSAAEVAGQEAQG